MTAETIDRLLGKILERSDSQGREIHEIKVGIEGLAKNSGESVKGVELRIAALELQLSARAGGTRMALLMLSGAATLGGIGAALIEHLWPWPR
jgi:hypothetical protein